MKVQCDVCERAEATVLCCADEAALCSICDANIHAANKLAGKHQRIPLHRSQSHITSCDICQERSGYFFCLEDRALLCRQCDFSVHTATPQVSSHQRFLLTGIRVGLHQCAVENNNSCSSSSGGDGNNNNNNNGNCFGNRSSCNRSSSEVVSGTSTEINLQSTAATEVGTEELGGFRGQWEWSDILAGSDFDHSYDGISEFEFSAVDNHR